MSSRREFIFESLGVAAALSLGVRPAQAGGDFLTRVVFEARYGDSVQFARRLGVVGLRHENIEGDVSGLWFERLEPALREGPQVWAGLTTEISLLCLETLASRYRLRTVFRCEHLYLGDGQMEHLLHAPAEMLEAGGALGSAGARWPAGAADLVAKYRPGLRPAPGCERHSMRLDAPPQSGVEALVSWVLAPLTVAHQVGAVRTT